MDYDQVHISWAKNTENNGSVITKYIVRILKKDNTNLEQFIEDKNLCDGSKLDANGELIHECTMRSDDL